MMKKGTILTDITATRSSGNELRRMLRIFLSRRIVIFGFAIILVLLIGAVFAPLLAPYDPYEQNLEEALKAPGHAHCSGLTPSEGTRFPALYMAPGRHS
jgi:ABC-type antimicrobial peptide transport system permease subunit